MVDFTRRNFLLGSSTAVGSAALFPFLFTKVKDLIIPQYELPIISQDNVLIHIEAIALDMPEVKLTVYPSNFKPRNFSLTVHNELVDILNDQGKRYKRATGKSDIELEFDIWGSDIRDNLYDCFLNGQAVYIPIQCGPDTISGQYLIREFTYKDERV